MDENKTFFSTFDRVNNDGFLLVTYAGSQSQGGQNNFGIILRPFQKQNQTGRIQANQENL